MAAPSTPQRQRKISIPDASTRTPARAAARTATKVSLNSPTKPSGTASPQVTAALAALRAKRQQQQSTGSAAADPFSTPQRSSNSSRVPVSDILDDDLGPGSPSKVVTVAAAAEGSEEPAAKVLLEWGGKTTQRLLNEAKRTGRLNLASRSLHSLPPRAYDTLAPTSSPYHTSRRRRPSSTASPENDLTSKASDADIDDQDVAWYEQVDLTSLVLANNEIEQLEEEIGGFEDLQTLDLHNNCLASLPDSIAFLTRLTSLNLASNKLSTLPSQILALNNLKDLDLSSNLLTELWPRTWQTLASEAAARRPAHSPSASPDAPRTNSNSFWSRSDPECTVEEHDSDAPFPRLRSLSVADNPLAHTTLHDSEFILPANIATLDLSRTRLRKVPTRLLSRLPKLAHLRLVGNALTDTAFALEASEKVEDDLLFAALETLDVSNNALDTLEHVELLFGRPASSAESRIRIEWIGLDKAVSNVIRSTENALMDRGPAGSVNETNNVELRTAKVTVYENRLSLEQGRRRAIWRAVQDSSDMTRTMAALHVSDKSSATQAQDESLTDAPSDEMPPPYSPSDVSNSPAQPVKIAEASEPAVEVVSDDHAAVVLAQSGRTAAQSALDLHSRQLESLPELEGDACLPPHLRDVSRLNLAQNAFKALPLVALHDYSWSRSLVLLNLSRNKITSIDLPSACSSGAALLPNLKTLDLSWNQLTSDFQPISGDVAPTSLFSTVATLAPNLLTLDLCQNKLTTANGIEQLLLGGVKDLLLQGNKIDDVSALANLGEKMADGEEQAAELRKQWKCEVMDLRDNEIARLPPLLGNLPHSLFIHLSGNRFRVPRREMYEIAGQRLVLPWLKERI